MVRIHLPPAKSPRRTAPAVGAGTPLRKGGTDGSNPVPSRRESAKPSVPGPAWLPIGFDRGGKLAVLPLELRGLASERKSARLPAHASPREAETRPERLRRRFGGCRRGFAAAAKDVRAPLPSPRQFGLTGSSSPICELRVRHHAAGCIEREPLHFALASSHRLMRVLHRMSAIGR